MRTEKGVADMKTATKIGVAVAGAAGAAAAAFRMTKRQDEEPRDADTNAEPVIEPDIDGDAFVEHLGAAG